MMMVRKMALALLISLSAAWSHAAESRIEASADASTQVPAVAEVLAPSGELRVGVYPGSPTSMVIDARSGETHGVAVELGQALAQALHRPVRLVRFERVAQVVEALRASQVDMTFTNATAVRAQWVDFTDPLIQLELGVLVANASPVRQLADANQSTFRLGVTQGSSSLSVLPQRLPLAQIVPVVSLDDAQRMLMAGSLDGFATNKGILFELNEHLQGFKVLDGRWGLEHLAIAIPKGRERAMPFLKAFAQQQMTTGAVLQAAQRAGLKGLARD